MKTLKFVLLVLALAGMAFHAALVIAQDREESHQVLIFLVDSSRSMLDLPEPDTTQAMITQAIHVASLSKRPVKIAVILFNGKGVQVLGDDQGMPTAAIRTLHQQVLTQWSSPFGGTPQDEALQACAKIITKLPMTATVTVVNIGDGRPSSGRLRPEDFSEIQKEVDRQIKAIQAQPYPPRTIQQLIANRRRVLEDPTTEEFKQLYQLQLKTEFEACLRHAAVIKDKKARFVSVDFDGQLTELRQIHEAAGGKDVDYLVVQPANTIIGRLHDLGLTQLDGIIVPKPVTVGADQGAFERTTAYLLDRVGNAAIVTIVFERPIARFAENARLTILSDEQTYSFDVQNPDPNALLSFDAAGNVAAATLVLSHLPANGELRIEYQSPALSLHPPAMTIYAHLRVSDELRIEARPANASADASPAYIVPTSRGLEWLFGLRFEGDPTPYPLVAVEPVWKSRLDGSELRADTEPDPRSPGVFRSAAPVQLPMGIHDLELNLVLQSGAQIRLHLSDHVQAQDADEHITMQYDETSRSDDHLDLGEVGDEARAGTATVVVRTAHVQYPLPVEIRVVGMADPAGTTPQTAWIEPAQTQVTLAPGRAQKVTLRWELPELIEDGLIDGRYLARLQFRRLDHDAVMDVRPFDPAVEPVDSQINDISFVLRRPLLLPSAPRGLGDSIKNDGQKYRLLLPVDFGVPFRRTVTIQAQTTSRLPRDVTATLVTPFRDQKGANVRLIEMAPAEASESTQTVQPDGTASFIYTLQVAEGDNLRGGEAMLRLSAPGVKSLEIPVVVNVREPLLGLWLRWLLYLLAILLIILFLKALLTLRKAIPFTTGQQLRLDPTQPAVFLSVQPASKGQARLTATGQATVKREKDNRERPLSSSRFSPSDVSPTNPLIVTRKEPDGQDMVIKFTDWATTPEGDPELHGEVINSGRFDEEARTTSRKAQRTLLLAAACTCCGLLLFHRPVLATVQWMYDSLPF